MTYLYPTTAPRVLAHRGLTIDAFGSPIDENTIPAFARAMEVGATHIESDIQVTADGVAVLFHDDDLARVAGIPSKISEVSIADLRSISLDHGGCIPTLQEALDSLPNARFNLDFKVAAAVSAGSKVIQESRAIDRVLVASFSDARRLGAQALLPGAVASAGSGTLLACRLLSAMGARNPAWALRGAAAIQVPVSSGPILFASKKFIGKLASTGIETHFWTINNPDEMKRLVALGAAGVVTDRADLAVAALL